MFDTNKSIYENVCDLSPDNDMLDQVYYYRTLYIAGIFPMTHNPDYILYNPRVQHNARATQLFIVVMMTNPGTFEAHIRKCGVVACWEVRPHGSPHVCVFTHRVAWWISELIHHWFR